MAFIINDECHRRIYQILLFIHLMKRENYLEWQDFYESFGYWDKCEWCGKERFNKDLHYSYDGEEKVVCINCDD